jgi:serine/threonine protein kinase
MSERERKGSAESKKTARPTDDTADSFLRAAAQVSEPSPSAIDAAQGRASRTASADHTAGEVIAKRYRLDEELGQGGFGVVWSATHVVTRRRVAIKFLRGPADLRTDLRRRFLREARAASAVDHPNVVDVIDVFELEDETPVIVMELLLGETLRQRLARERRLPLGEAAAILLQVVGAVGSGHALGIVHRDLKPENIFLARGSAGEAVKVLDFGIAKLLAPDADTSDTDSLTGTGSMLGTPCYMAPEQTLAEKNIDHRADIWALGVILYECLAGVRPVQGSGVGQVVMKLATEGIRPLDQVMPELPHEATALVMHMLTRERAGRPQDLQHVHEVLSRFADPALPFATTAISYRTPLDEKARRELSQTSVVDTESPQALPRGARRTPRRSLFVSVAAAGILLIAFFGWRVSAPTGTTSTARPLSGTSALPWLGTSAPLPLTSALAQPGAPSSVVPVLPTLPGIASAPSTIQSAQAAGARTAHAGPPALSPPPTTARPNPAPTPSPSSATSEKPVADPAPVASESASAKPKAVPGGLAEKPPF